MTTISDINIEKYEKAQRFINREDKDVLDYVLLIMNGEQFEYNLRSKLIVDDDHDKKILDQYIKAYQTIFAECKKNRRTDLKEFVSRPGNEWMSVIPSTVLSIAKSLAITKARNEENEFGFGLRAINMDGRIHIPKLASFKTARRLLMPNGCVPSLGFVMKNDDGSYSIAVTTKKARK